MKAYNMYKNTEFLELYRLKLIAEIMIRKGKKRKKKENRYLIILYKI